MVRVCACLSADVLHQIMTVILHNYLDGEIVLTGKHVFLWQLDLMISTDYRRCWYRHDYGGPMWRQRMQLYKCIMTNYMYIFFLTLKCVVSAKGQ